MELTHVRLLVSNFESTYRFYEEVLGLKAQRPAPQGPYVKFTLPDGHTAISLQSRTHFETHSVPLRKSSGDDLLLAVHVKDVEATATMLRAKTVEVSEVKPLFGAMKVAYLRDPEGTLIELQEW